MVNRVVEPADDVAVEHLGLVEPVTELAAGDRAGVEVEKVGHAGHHRSQAAGVEEILHQIGVAARPHIGQHRHLFADGVEIIKAEVDAGAPGHGDQMDDGVGRTAHRHGHF